MTVKHIVRGAIIGAAYSALTVLLAPISYGPIQVRVSEALTVLPFLDLSAVWGLFVGCILANVLGGLGWWDIVCGSLLTLGAALVTFWLGKVWRNRGTGKVSGRTDINVCLPALAPLPPVIFNAFGVSAYLQLLFSPPSLPIPFLRSVPPYFVFAITVGVGEIVACYVLGYPLLFILMRYGGKLGFGMSKC
ncbi:MAG: QueT transporter family protein [bacterium]